jgi:aspartate/methionine/tyrosine aminotransferase
VAPQQAVAGIDRLAQNLYLAAPTPAQYAALAAFDPENIAILEARRLEFRARRDYLLPALRALGFDITGTPEGAFYIYADCSRFTDDSYGFSVRLLEEAGVAITPGIDFGEHRPERHVRFAYTTSLENLKEGVRRLKQYLGSQVGGNTGDR